MTLKQTMRQMLSAWLPFLSSKNNPVDFQEDPEPLAACKGDSLSQGSLLALAEKERQLRNTASELDNEIAGILQEDMSKYKPGNRQGGVFSKGNDILVVPSNFEDTNLNPDSKRIYQELIARDKVIRLDYIKTPAMVKT